MSKLDPQSQQVDLRRRQQLQPACDLAVEIMRVANKSEQPELLVLQIRRICLKALQDAADPEMRGIMGSERDKLVQGLPRAPEEAFFDLKVPLNRADGSQDDMIDFWYGC